MHLCALVLNLAAQLLGGQTPPHQDENVYFSNSEKYFTATGKWAAVSANAGEQVSMPHEVEIDCFKGNACVVGSAEYYVGAPHITLAYVEILKWTHDGILAEDTSGICMTQTLHISFADQRVMLSFTSKALPKEQRDSCKFFGAEPTEEIMVLKGSKRWHDRN